MLKRFKFILAFLIITISTGASANSDWVQSEKIKARIVDEQGKLGVEIEPEAGWHTYYKVAGDAGDPTRFNFTGSSDFETSEVVFPAYKVIDEYGFKTNAYEGMTFFPIKAKTGENPHIKLEITGAVCHEICVPYDLKFDYVPKLDAAANKKGNSFGYIILISLVAGLILNVMPCVLPVLSLKIFSVLKQSGKKKKQARGNFLAAAAGIVFSFLALAGVAISLKSAGEAVGWGLHFQSPYFVAALMLITFFFSLSLFGAFHLRPPSWLGGGNKKSNANSLWGNFLAGTLATLLGTSCTAPVLVTAVGYALAGTTSTIIIIFFVMGIGMAAPYLLLAYNPGLVGFLPKPGKWMERVKFGLGILMLTTTAWLGFVLYAQTSGGVDMSQVMKFDEQQIPQLLAENKIVFVDITAKWCVNCKVNKAAVIDSGEIQKFFADNHVIFMEGDITKPSPKIFEYVRQFGRYGIPMNVVYGPGAPNGILLDALLTKDSVKEAIVRAEAKP